MSILFTIETEFDMEYGGMRSKRVRNPKIDFVCMCDKCGEFGTRSQYGCDDECPNCGAELDWSKEVRW